MDLATKLRDLREHAGHIRGLARPLTQAEVAVAIQQDGGKISQAYLSQLERGRRVHLTKGTRDQLAHFFGVHPGYLVSDPEAHHDAPYHLHHPRAHRALARLAVHPRGTHIWPLVEALIDLPEEEFHSLHAWVNDRIAGVTAAGVAGDLAVDGTAR